MASKNEAGEKLMDELLNTLANLRDTNKEKHGIDAVRVDDISKLAEAYSRIGEHFNYKSG